MLDIKKEADIASVAVHTYVLHLVSECAYKIDETHQPTVLHQP